MVYCYSKSTINNNKNENMNNLSHDFDKMNIESDDESDIFSMLNSIHNGQEPLMVKICKGEASTIEIEQWALKQGIDLDELPEVLKMIKSSYNAGSTLAHKLGGNNNYRNGNVSNEIIGKRLQRISSQLSAIKSEVDALIDLTQSCLDQPNCSRYDPPYDPKNYSALL